MAAAGHPPTRRDMIQRVKTSLIAKGYSEKPAIRGRFVAKLRRILRRETTWNPDICLSYKGKRLFVADVQILDNRRSQYIPTHMEFLAPTISSNFPSAKMVLFIPLGASLEASAIQNAAKLKISIEAIDLNGNLYEILNPSKTCRSSRASAEQDLAVLAQVNSGWYIPKALVEKALRVQRLDYSKRLKEFAKKYLRKRTRVNLEDQYKLAFKCVKEILNDYRIAHCSKSLLVSRYLQQLARERAQSRDHFLHSFQTFLIGAIILDHCDRSVRPINLSLCGRCPRLDLPWLLASIFHDYGFDIVDIESPLHVRTASFHYQSTCNLQFSNAISSYFDFKKNTMDDLDTWNPNSYHVVNNDLQSILFDAALDTHTENSGEGFRPNHGVVSSYEILEFEQELSAPVPGSRPIFSSAAFSAALHDKEIWANLFERSILPIDAAKFPLFYLLVMSDTLAEAGRPTSKHVNEHEAVLVEFRMRLDSVYSSVWFSNPERAYIMNFLVDFIQERCFINPYLDFRVRSLHS